MRNVIDMTLKRLSLTMVIGLALLPLAAVAQQQGRTTHVITIGKRGWLGISYDFTSTSRDGKTTETLTEVDVSKDSPADRAGLKKGDAADRPAAEGMLYLRGDSVNRTLRIFLDSARAGMFRMDSLFGDSIFLRGFPDMRMWSDRMPDIRVWRGQMDSVFFHGRDGGMRFFSDSVPMIWRRLDVPPGFDMVMPRFEELAERAVAGAEFTPINEGLSGYFGTDRGLLVVKVGPQTPAARAGLLAGDVITRVDGQAVDEVIDLRRAVTRAGNETMKLEILRKGKARTLEFQPRVRR